MLSHEQVTQFQTLYRNCFDEEISSEEAYEMGVRLIRLMQLIYTPMTKEEYQLLQERRQETGKVEIIS